MGIRFVLMVNKQGQTRLAQYYEYLTLEERRALEGEIVRKCLARNEQQVLQSSFRSTIQLFRSVSCIAHSLYAIQLSDFEFSLLNCFSSSLMTDSVPLSSIATTK